jgi:hypothetical protein
METDKAVNLATSEVMECIMDNVSTLGHAGITIPQHCGIFKKNN